MKPLTTSKRRLSPERIYELILKNLREATKNKKIKRLTFRKEDCFLINNTIFIENEITSSDEVIIFARIKTPKSDSIRQFLYKREMVEPYFSKLLKIYEKIDSKQFEMDDALVAGPPSPF